MAAEPTADLDFFLPLFPLADAADATLAEGIVIESIVVVV
jgi:hypothetical protein